jgi:hypothetical protein
MDEIESKQWGATQDDWFTFSLQLGLTEDLLPVVSNPNATISPKSSLKQLGKTPSLYTYNNQVIGISDWTTSQADEDEIDHWSRNPDYGICVIARKVKAIDIDVDDQDLVARIQMFIHDKLNGMMLPKRYRDNACKCILAFRLEEDTLKRVIRTKHGVIEFLGNRQQFIAAGTHPSGSRYQWAGLNDDIPHLDAPTFEQLWQGLQNEFGIEPEIREKERRAKPRDEQEPMLRKLYEKNMVISEGRNGSINIVCPYAHEHTTPGPESSTVYWPAHTGGYALASINCLHAHCADRDTPIFAEALGLGALDDFEDISGQTFTTPPVAPHTADPSKFKLVEIVDLALTSGAPEWRVKNLIPKKGVGLIFGPSSSGKTFAVLDMIGAVARGVDWNGLKTKQGRSVYICAEGAYSFSNRGKAYMQEYNLTTPLELPISVIDGKLDLMRAAEVRDLVAAIQSLGEPIATVVVDTYAKCMVGDENSGIDVGRVIANCEMIMELLNTTVILIHHSGKDTAKGARGWSGLRGAVDFEIEVQKLEQRHAMRVTKQKDGESGREFAFGLKEVVLGVDDDLEPVTSCVLHYDSMLPLMDKPGERIENREGQVYSELQNYYEETDEWPTKDQLIERTADRTGHKLSDLQRAYKRLLDRGRIIEEMDGTVKMSGGL